MEAAPKTNASSKGRSYQQKQQPGEEDDDVTPVEAEPKTILINKELHESMKHTNALSRRFTPKDTKYTAASFQLQPQTPNSAATPTVDPRSIESYMKVLIVIRKALHKYL